MDFRKPRCVLVYAIAPEGTTAAEANRTLNEFVADRTLPLALFHDHFLGEPGGVALFFVGSPEERDALSQGLTSGGLASWRTEARPLIFSYSPAAFDEQIAYTLRSYRAADWSTLRDEQRPSFGSPAEETQTGSESP